MGKVRIYYRLPVRCRCGATMRLRITAEGKKAFAKILASDEVRDEDVIQTYQCARRLPDGSLCNELIEIKAGDWRRME